MTLNEILNRPFRANPAYHLIAYDCLPQEQREHLGPVADDEDFYGVLVDGVQTKAVDPDTALLLLTLREPGPIPTYVRRRLGHRANRAMVELVLDDVLQVGDGDTFISGPSAHALVYASDTTYVESTHSLARLSHEALRYAAHLPLMLHARLAMRLYMYNTIPLSATWTRRLPDEATNETWLNLDTWKNPDWQCLPSTEPGGWIQWRHRRTHHGELPYKLYISPHPETLPELFPVIAEVLGRRNVPSFKLGKGVQGLLRPDKMVAYLPDFEHLADVARVLQNEIGHARAQGVPFTAPIDEAGLLSWGMDPPDAAHVFAGHQRESWRFWITQHLATALITVASDSSDVDPTRYALDRLRLDGIDTDRWIPQQSIWNA